MPDTGFHKSFDVVQIQTLFQKQTGYDDDNSTMDDSNLVSLLVSVCHPNTERYGSDACISTKKRFEDIFLPIGVLIAFGIYWWFQFKKLHPAQENSETIYEDHGLWQLKQRKERIQNKNKTSISTSISTSTSTKIEDDNDLEEPLLKEKAATYSISFKNLQYKLDDGSNKILLHDVDGHANPGELTAVMGGSGAGKSTLLELLSQQKNLTSGSLRVNDEEISSDAAFSQKIRDSTAIVPQDDILHPDLTVEELLRYSLCLQINKFQAHKEHNRRQIQNTIDYALDQLGLETIRSSLIGTVQNRGISGGQKRRVSIAMELVKDPKILFLDEPTSGLDSMTALSLIHCLSDLAKEAKNTIVMTIHQPSIEIFYQINHVILLLNGGYTVYSGSPLQAKSDPLFSSHNFSTAFQNPADHVLEVMQDKTFIEEFKRIHEDKQQKKITSSLKTPSDANEESTNTLQYDEDDETKMPHDDGTCPGTKDEYDHELVDAVRNLSQQNPSFWQKITSVIASELSSGGQKVKAFLTASVSSNELRGKKNVDMKRPGFIKQLKICLNRSRCQWMRRYPTHLVYLALCTFSSFIVSFVFRHQFLIGLPPSEVYINGDVYVPLSQEASNPIQFLFPSVFLMILLNIGLMAMSSSVYVLNSEYDVFLREANGGGDTRAYFLSKILIEPFSSCYRSLAFTWFFMLLFNPFGECYLYFIAFFLVDLTCSAIGMFAVASLTKKAMFGGVIMIMAAAILSGLNPPFTRLSELGKVASVISFARWSLELLAQIELSGYYYYYPQPNDRIYITMDGSSSHSWQRSYSDLHEYGNRIYGWQEDHGLMHSFWLLVALILVINCGAYLALYLRTVKK